MAESRSLTKNSWILVLQCALILTATHHQSCSAACPPPPVRCPANSDSCYVTNYRGEWEDQNACKVSRAFFPKTESELIQAVAYAVKKEKKVKVVSGGSHSLTGLACPGGEDGVIISTRDYNALITVDEESMAVTADAGVGFRKLVNTLAEEGFALPHTTDWDGVSVAGAISTAAHGSCVFGKGGGIYEHVVGIKMVVPAAAEEGYAKLIHLKEKDEDLNAARVSLGVLGAISQVTFAVEKMFKRSVRLELKYDSDLEKTFVPFAESHEFGSIYWFPSFSGVLYTIQDRVAVDVPGDGKLSQTEFGPMTVESFLQFRLAEELSSAKVNTSNLCKRAKSQIEKAVETGKGFLNNGETFKGFPVVGYNHRMQSSSGCQIDLQSQKDGQCLWGEKKLENEDTICGWDTQVKGTFYYHTSIAIPLSRIAEAITDMKQIRDTDPSALCDLDTYLGVQLRYFKKSTAYLAHKEDSAVVEFIYFRNRDLGIPRWNGHVMDEIEQMLLQKYEGVPHWGKNRVYTFDGAAKRAVNVGKFLKVKQQFDPKGYFSSEWSDEVLGIGKGVQVWQDGCGLDGLCVCEEDRHCAPDKGYVCRPGKFWKDARVCKGIPTMEETKTGNYSLSWPDSDNSVFYSEA
ncbi:hypothetical protein SUGI_0710090 [Cryptomeria japonica]|uniref:L-gulonolactone oxidase 5 n=1 Tax=Cryptomeria japonica TaxID=3369 RepID=UPI002414B31E|nr:L-gulonolactone oxidase 5 [Cryptomeria japonica]GLJ35293.1 hypothetical protein SUGI_0710090 [Cryptomeria japonica]